QVEFMAEIPESFDVFALVVVESNQEDFHVPSQVISILEEFADVGPQELPSGLPPMRDIQHCIDFVPGAKGNEEDQPRGRRGRRGGYARKQPYPGADINEEEPRPNSRDQRDLEIVA
ncbi:hypothetical protein Tco_0433859, partial [Tanacetum coccineum]